VRDVDELEAHRVEAHHLGGDGVDGHLIAGGEHVVLDHGEHRARPGAVARGGAVHDREEAAVDLLLDGEEIHQSPVDPRVRVVPVRREEAAEGVLHRAGGRGVDVALDRRQVQDVLAEEVVGDADARAGRCVEHVHLRLGLVLHPLHVLVLEVVEDRDVVLLEEREVVVEVFALEGVGHHRLVLDAGDVLEALLLEGEDGALRAATASCWPRGRGSATRCCP
jgi:hypothetical protein